MNPSSTRSSSAPSTPSTRGQSGSESDIDRFPKPELLPATRAHTARVAPPAEFADPLPTAELEQPKKTWRDRETEVFKAGVEDALAIAGYKPDGTPLKVHRDNGYLLADKEYDPETTPRMTEALYSAGLSESSIARLFGIPRRTLISWLKRPAMREAQEIGITIYASRIEERMASLVMNTTDWRFLAWALERAKPRRYASLRELTHAPEELLGGESSESAVDEQQKATIRAAEAERVRKEHADGGSRLKTVLEAEGGHRDD